MWQFVKDKIYIIYKYQLQLASSKKATRTYVQEKTNYVCLHVHSCRKLLILHLRIPLFEIYSFIKNGCWIIHNKVIEITIKTLSLCIPPSYFFFATVFKKSVYKAKVIWQHSESSFVVLSSLLKKTGFHGLVTRHSIWTCSISDTR